LKELFEGTIIMFRAVYINFTSDLTNLKTYVSRMMVKIKNTRFDVSETDVFLDFEVQQRYTQMEGVKGFSC
jgi:hypothetical protein